MVVVSILKIWVSDVRQLVISDIPIQGDVIYLEHFDVKVNLRSRDVVSQSHHVLDGIHVQVFLVRNDSDIDSRRCKVWQSRYCFNT